MELRSLLVAAGLLAACTLAAAANAESLESSARPAAQAVSLVEPR